MVALLLGLLLELWAAFTFQLDDVRISPKASLDFGAGWTVTTANFGEEPITLPGKVDTSGQQEVLFMLENALPTSLEGIDTLFFTTNHQRLRVYLGDELIYEFGYQQQTSFGSVFGTAWHFIPLDKNAKGTAVRMEISAPSPFSQMSISAVRLGDRASLLLELGGENVGRLLFSFICFLSGLVFVLVALTLRLRRVTFPLQGMATVGILQILAATWVLFDSSVCQLF